MDSLLQQSRAIIDEAITTYKPYAIVSMVSGGDDSLTADAVTRLLGVKVDYILHGITGTGVKSTTEHVRQYAAGQDSQYIEANAGDAYERYVLRKGWYGIGHTAHLFAYHTLKHQYFRAALSAHIRQRQTGRNILLINGARAQESKNRKSKLHSGPINPDPDNQRNIWVNALHDWSKRDCVDFMQEQRVQRCPAATYCHRSGECMCGTMQQKDEAAEIAFFFPDWAEWWHGIRARVAAAGFGWDWGEDVPPAFKARKEREKAIKAGQLDLFNDYLPMCHSCQATAAKVPA